MTRFVAETNIQVLFVKFDAETKMKSFFTRFCVKPRTASNHKKTSYESKTTRKNK